MKLKQQGVSLIELLITMALGSLLLAGLIGLYVSDKKTYHLTQALARMQEDGRTAMQMMSSDVRMAGYVGCGRLSEITTNDQEFDTSKSLVGWHDGNSSATMRLPIIKKDLKPKTDVLLVQMADAHTIAVLSTTNNKIHFAEQHDFSGSDLLFISDCQKADVFNFNQPNFQKPYQEAQVSRWQKIIYYVAETQRDNKNDKTVYALYRRDLNAAATMQNELIDGVEDMQISYGEATAADSYISYMSAENVKDWQAIRSVKIDLLLVSKDAVNDAPQTYEFLGKKYQATDRRLYRAWQTVVVLRERAS